MTNRWLTASLLLLVSAGCMSTSYGKAVAPDTTKQIRVGTTTKAELTQLLGPPVSRVVFPGRPEVWSWHYSKTESSVSPTAFIPFVGLFHHPGKGSSDTQTLEISFQGDVVVGCRRTQVRTRFETSGMSFLPTGGGNEMIVEECGQN